MVMVKASDDSEAGVMPGEQLLADMGRYNEELVKAGIMLDGTGLKPSKDGVRVRFSGTERTVIDGPFPETKELLAGYWLLQVKSMEEAVEWVRRCPNPHPEECEVEIRPLFEMPDFEMSAETRATHERVAAAAAGGSGGGRELVLTRDIDAPRERVFEAWTRRLPEWWGPHGMTTPVCEMDLRPGGVLRTVMRDAQGKEYPTQGVFLEVAAPERIVFTDAFLPGWEPNPEAFFTAVITFDALPGKKTRYTARALHWTEENRRKHEEMGFAQGWGESLDRLVSLVTQR